MRAIFERGISTLPTFGAESRAHALARAVSDTMANGSSVRVRRLMVTLPVTRRSAEARPDRRSREFWRKFRRGGMAEWSMAVVLKTTAPERVPGVRRINAIENGARPSHIEARLLAAALRIPANALLDAEADQQ